MRPPEAMVYGPDPCAAVSVTVPDVYVAAARASPKRLAHSSVSQSPSARSMKPLAANAADAL